MGTSQWDYGVTMKKALDLRKLAKEAEERAKHKNNVSTDKEIQSSFLKAFNKLAQADDKNYSEVLKSIKRKK